MTFGETLRQARQKKGLSLEQVAASTRIRVSYLEALEAEDISRLPERTFSRSFLRQYAQELGLDPAPLLQELGALMPAQPTQIDALPSGGLTTGRRTAPARASASSSTQNAALGGLLPLLLGGALLLGGGAYLLSRGHTAAPAVAPAPVAPAQPANVNLTVNSVPDGALVYLDNRELGRAPVQSFPVGARKSAVLRVEYAGRLSFKQNIDLRTGRNLRVRLMPVGLGPSVMTDIATGRVQESLPVPAPKAPPVPVKGVTLRLSDASWLRVTASSGRILFEGVAPAGTVQTYDKGVMVRAGNAGAVQVSVDGSAPAAMGASSQVVTRSY